MNVEITFKNETYILDEEYWKGEAINDSIEFQHMQLTHCIEVGDYTTLENRISNMLLWGGVKLKT